MEGFGERGKSEVSVRVCVCVVRMARRFGVCGVCVGSVVCVGVAVGPEWADWPTLLPDRYMRIRHHHLKIK